MASFIPYLTTYDYLGSIQTGQLSQILTGAGLSQRRFAEEWARGIIKSKIGSQFDVDFEITPTLPYDITSMYYANQRCVIDFPEWVSGADYNSEDLMIKSNTGYVCLMPNNDSIFDESKWQSIGEKNSIYSIPLPYHLFSLYLEVANGNYTKGYYNTDDRVWWNNHIYKCLVPTLIFGQDSLVQYQNYNKVPAPNIFPNDKNLGSSYWKDEGEYSVSPGILPIESPWVLQDNRDPLIVQCMVDLALWMLHRRISPDNIPTMREQNKDAAFQWLSDVKSDTAQTEVKELQPPQGQQISWGSKTKQTNGY